ncbi:HEAT repeat-containing protein 6-like isoform X1 [Varroa destructor]|uniref:HEAT repeat-containing protein 6 n=1 Tax=Varroa destructor TaxID=109461 RepID=A0A7M7KVH9_VARDE|nr:HEAT repeat-containing protein 6-like isoform X1 [Varroa destructor]
MISFFLFIPKIPKPSYWRYACVSSDDVRMGDSVAAEQTLHLFECLNKLKNALHRNTTNVSVDPIIKDLLELNYEIPFLTSDVGSDLLRICLLHCDGLKFSATTAELTKQLIWALQTSQGNQLDLDDRTLLKLIHFCLRDVRQLEVPQLLLSFHTLGTLVYQNSHRLESVWLELFTVLKSCLAINESNVAVRHSALKVLQALTIRRGGPEDFEYLSPEQAEAISSLIIDGVANMLMSADELMLCKVLQASMKTLLNMATAQVPLPANQLGYLLGWLRHLTFLGFPGYAQRPIKNFDLFPSPVCHQLPQVDLKDGETSTRDNKPVMRRSRVNKKARKKEPRKDVGGGQQSVYHDSPSEDSDTGGASPSRIGHQQPPWAKTDSSDSEMSDVEGSAGLWTVNGSSTNISPLTLAVRVKAAKAKVRQLAYDTIRMLLLNIDKNERFGYVLNFLPQQSGSLMRSTEHTLVLSMLKDPSAHVRSSAINVLKDFVSYSKNYLILACESVHATSFTSISEVMAIVISELHRALHLALLAEQIPIFLVPLLSCLSLLIGASPYSRLKPILITEMCADLKLLLQNNKYEQVRVGALTCLGGVVSYQPSHAEIVRCLGLESDHWLERLCIEKLSPCTGEVNQVKLEVLQTLSLLVANHFEHCKNVFDHYIQALNWSLTDPYGPVKIHGMKLTAALAKQISDLITGQKDEQKQLGCELGRLMWRECLFQGVMQCCLQSTGSEETTEHGVREQQVLQRETFTALANIGAEMWEDLPQRNQRFCICVLLAQARDTTDDTAAAAVRTLAFFCTYRYMVQDTIFLQDVGELCVALLKKKTNMSLKMKASWALSNVCDALWTLRISEPERFDVDINTDFYTSLLETSVNTYAEKDSIRINAVRSMGILLGMGTSRYLSVDERLIRKAIEHLLQSATYAGVRFFKAKWNACYAIGWMMANAHTRCMLDVPTAMKTLSDNLMNCVNLKVQIACISALDQLSDCEDIEPEVRFGAFITLVQKVEQVPAIQVDYKELKHLQSVKEQLSLALINYLIVAGGEGQYLNKMFKQLESVRDAAELLLKSAMSCASVREKLSELFESEKGLRVEGSLPNTKGHLRQAFELYAFQI